MSSQATKPESPVEKADLLTKSDVSALDLIARQNRIIGEQAQELAILRAKVDTLVWAVAALRGSRRGGGKVTRQMREDARVPRASEGAVGVTTSRGRTDQPAGPLRMRKCADCSQWFTPTGRLNFRCHQYPCKSAPQPLTGSTATADVAALEKLDDITMDRSGEGR